VSIGARVALYNVSRCITSANINPSLIHLSWIRQDLFFIRFQINTNVFYISSILHILQYILLNAFLIFIIKMFFKETAIFIGLITILITDDRISCNITLFHVTLYNFHLITGMERRKHEMERLGLWRCTRPQNTAESAVET